ncbi:Nuf2 family-domain-containing protein [Gautieria morchelliformis]|nr:Nuf2 family-domain-containing protein [Gautieria morchelliformis]
MAASFSYPNVELQEIALVVHSWGYPIVEDDLRPPKGLKPEIVQMVYACAIQKLTGLTIAELEQSAERSLAVIEEWQLIAPSSRLHVLLYHATRVADGAGIDDFSMMDLVSPNFGRTHKILSAIVNFGRFSEERLPFVERLQQEYTRASEERDELQQEILNLRQKLTDHASQLKTDEPICVQLAAENQGLTAKLRDLYEEQNAGFQEAEALKVERDKLVLRKAGIQDEINVALDTNSRTKARIVQSPERLQRIITTMGDNAVEERRNVLANEAKARTLKLKLDTLVAYEQDIQTTVSHLTALTAEQESLDASLGKLAKAKADLERQIVVRKELELQQERAERRKANAEQKVEREQKYADEQREKSQGTIAKLKKEFEEMSLERRDNDHVVEETKREAAEIEQKMAEHLRQNEEELTKLLEEYWRLRHQTEVYMETLANKLGLDLEAVNTR